MFAKNWVTAAATVANLAQHMVLVITAQFFAVSEQVYPDPLVKGGAFFAITVTVREGRRLHFLNPGMHGTENRAAADTAQLPLGFWYNRVQQQLIAKRASSQNA
eukprot:scaffold97324_cov19-Tisochrysis_lutea.AAC.1